MIYLTDVHNTLVTCNDCIKNAYHELQPPFLSSPKRLSATIWRQPFNSSAITTT